jgi:hypothetical protein
LKQKRTAQKTSEH